MRFFTEEEYMAIVSQIEPLVQELEADFGAMGNLNRHAFMTFVIKNFPTVEAFRDACCIIYTRCNQYVGGKVPCAETFLNLYRESIESKRPELKPWHDYKGAKPEEVNLLPPGEAERGVNRSQWVGCSPSDVSRLRAKLSVASFMFKSDKAKARAQVFLKEVKDEAKARNIPWEELESDNSVQSVATGRHLHAV